MNYPCGICGRDSGVERVDSALANGLAKSIRCEDCERPIIELAGRERAERRDAEHLRRVAECLPKALSNYRFSTSPAPREAIKAAREWAGDGGVLTLTGEVGRGKTGLAAAAVWTRLYAEPIRWVSVPTLLTNLMGPNGSKQREQAAQFLRGKSSIALDDLDKFKPGEWAASQIFACIDNVITSGNSLINTTNKTPGELAGFIGGEVGAAIASRLSAGRVVRVTGPDHRLTKAAA